MLHLNSRQYRLFLHDVHHAYLLLHRALRTIPPTMIPDLEPMPHPSQGIPDQHAALLPDGPLDQAHDDDSPVPSPSPVEVQESPTDELFNAVMAQPTDEEMSEDLPDEQPPTIVPNPVRHVSAPDPAELPLPKTQPKVKKTPKRPRAKKSPAKKPPRAKTPTGSNPSTAAPPWTDDELTLLVHLKTDNIGRPSWKAVASRLKRSEADVKNQWALLQANAG